MSPAIPADLDGETALVLADLLYALAGGILARNDGAIRIHYAELDEARRADRDPSQIPLPGIDPFADLPF
ncbi:MAG: hypothetical protein JW751_18885 [Polyangiaceae bacterium]|nr:hypothetical protein [Polyangiaceae bacterium]